MKLRELKVQNFKGIRQQSIDFTDDLGRVNDLTLIVGPNGSGKTSILDAIWFGLMSAMEYPPLRDSFRLEPQYVVYTGNRYAEVSFDIEVTEQEAALVEEWQRKLINLNALGGQRPSPKTRATFSWTYPSQPSYREANRGGYKWLAGSNFVTLMGRNYFTRLKRISAMPMIQRDSVGSVYFFEQERQIIARPVRQFAPIPDDSVGNGFNDNEERYEDDMRRLLIDFGIKDKLGKRNPEDSWYQIIRSSYNYICSPHQMGEVYATMNNDTTDEYEIDFEYEGKKYSFDGLSSGERAVLNFMVQYVYKRMYNSIVLIDELELHLHPTWQRRFLQNLTRLNHGNQFIITTHSSTIRQGVPSINTIVLGELDEPSLQTS